MSLKFALDLQRELFSGSAEFAAELDKAFDAIGFTEEYIGRARRPRAPILIKDAIWGMMEFQRDEIAIIDTPLLQRLRAVHQLGFSRLTYPSAEHTRFSHSLGVSYVVKRFLAQATANSGHPVAVSSHEVQAAPCLPHEQQILRHAALLHDIGHFPFSHATERVFHNYFEQFHCGPRIGRFLGYFEQYLSMIEPKLAECLSIAIVLSPRFGAYYRKCVDPDASEDMLPSIALVIGGRPANDAFPGLSSILSHSNVDADKVDYLSRDSEFCGIPAGIDEARLFFRSMFVDLSGDNLKALAPDVFANVTHSQKHFIVNASGLDTIDEIIHARAIMYQRVYKHKATRLVERLYEKAFSSFVRRQGGQPHQVLNSWATTEYPLLDQLLQGEAVGDPKFFGWRVKQRFYPKRSLMFGAGMLSELPAPPIAALSHLVLSGFLKQVSGPLLSSLRAKTLFGQELDALEDEVHYETQALGALVDSEPVNRANSSISILPIEQIDGQNKDHIILEGTHLTYHKKASRRAQQVAGDEIDRSVGYVFTEPKWRELAQIAARKVLYLRGMRSSSFVRLPHEKKDIGSITLAPTFLLDRNELARRTGISAMKLEHIEAVAARKGYFDKYPRLLPYDGKDIEVTVLNRFAEFQGVEGWRVSRRHLENFITQFPPGLRAEAYKLSSEVKLLGKEAATTAFLELLSTLKGRMDDGVPKYLAPFTPNSGNNLRIMLEQSIRVAAADQGWKFLKSHTDALKVLADGGSVTFIDDNISSGSQARAQFHAFHGMPKDEWPEALRSEENAFEPHKVIPEGVGKGRVFLAVIVAEKRGIESIEADELCKSSFVSVHSWRFVADYSKPELSSEMQSFLKYVGAGLVRSTAPKWGAPEQHALGYGNLGALIVTPSNVPAGTITPFWMPGHVDGVSWLPLFIRRGYQKSLVI
jgi:deoxynucleoside triphosphate triphosphohydrolase SAMHD1